MFVIKNKLSLLDWRGILMHYPESPKVTLWTHIYYFDPLSTPPPFMLLSRLFGWKSCSNVAVCSRDLDPGHGRQGLQSLSGLYQGSSDSHCFNERGWGGWGQVLVEDDHTKHSLESKFLSLFLSFFPFFFLSLFVSWAKKVICRTQV